MPTIPLDPTLTTYYEDDCFADPWRKPEVALLVHGCAESSQAWYAWVPTLARELRVLRIDQRGFGRSTAPPPGYAWSATGFADDLARFLDALKVEAVHLVGAKVGGAISLQFAARYPERVRTLSLMHGIVLGFETEGGKAGEAHHTRRIPNLGVERWAAETQRGRLGSEASEELVDWWTKLMSGSDQRVCTEVTLAAARIRPASFLSSIQAPTLVLNPDHCSTAPVELVRDRQRQIANSELVLIPSDAYHLAAAKPEECARHVLEFIRRHSTEEG